MRKYLNQIDRIEQRLGIDEGAQYWLVNKLDDDMVKVTKITAGNTPDDSQHLTASEFEAFGREIGNDRLIMVEWIE